MEKIFIMSILGNVHLELFHDLSHLHFIAVTFIYVHQLIFFTLSNVQECMSRIFFVLDIE